MRPLTEMPIIVKVDAIRSNNRLDMKIRAKYLSGTLTPLGELDLQDGDVVTITIEAGSARSLEERRTASLETFGAWKDTIDCDKLIEDIYASRAVVSTRVPKF